MLVIDIAHGHSIVMAKALEAFRAGSAISSWSPATLRPQTARPISPSVASTASRWAWPGGGCTTRLNTNFGVPQLHALVECRLAVGSKIR